MARDLAPGEGSCTSGAHPRLGWLLYLRGDISFPEREQGRKYTDDVCLISSGEVSDQLIFVA